MDGSMVINMSTTAANATCIAGGGGLMHSGMELHAAPAPSPIGFAATMSAAMELENKLKAETVEGFPLSCAGEGSKTAFEGGHGIPLEDSCKDGSVRQLDQMEEKQNNAEKDEDQLDSSLPLDEELMDEEDDDDESIGHSSGSDGNVSYADISPGMPGTENLKGDVDLDEDLDPLQKLHNALGRNGLQMGADSGSQRTLNSRPDSSEGDYYDGGVSESSQTQPYHHHLHSRDDGSGNLENGDELYQCHLCSFTTNSKFQFHAHINSHYNHKCNHCDYTSRTEGRLKRHMKDFHSDLPLEAFSPGSLLKGDSESNGNSQGKVKTYRCKQCSFVATVKLDFWEHSKMHIKAEKLLTCPKCPFVTEYKHHLEYHLRNHFGSKPFKCPKCNYSCVNKSMLNSHMKSHSNIYQYRCANCTYATKYCHSLKLHLRKYAHAPSTVLNPDGTPNPMPVIDVYGTRRGPRTKKSQEDTFGGSAGGNSGNGGTLPFSPVPHPANGALSPGAAVMPFFYPGASGPLSNGFHSASSDLHTGNATKPPVASANGGGSGGGGTTCGSGSNGNGKDEELTDAKRQHQNLGPGALKCNLCEFLTDHREVFTKHMLLHAAAENQDICNLYGIASESVSQAESNPQQSQMNAAAMAAVVAALGLSNPSQTHRADLFRHHPLTSLPMHATQEPGQNFDRRGSAVLEASKVPKPQVEDSDRSPPPLLANPLEHLRAFSEQVNMKPFIMREFSSSLFSSGPLQNSGNHAGLAGNITSSQNVSDERHFLNGGTNPKVSPASHPKNVPKASKDDAIQDERSPQIGEGIPSLGPLDLSNAKIVHRHRPYHHPLQQHLQHPYVQQQLLHQHYSNLSALAQQPPFSTQGFLEISTDAGVMQGHSPTDDTSPTQAKNRRKGKAFKLDRICLKLQKDRSSPGHPSSGHTDDSMEDGDISKTSDMGDDVVKVELESGDMKETDHSMKKPSAEAENSAKLQCLQQDSRKTVVGKQREDSSQKADGQTSPTSNVNDDSSDWKEAYECQYCDMAFKDCIMYTVHMGYHGFKDPFKCNMCGQQTKDKVAFFLHIARTAHL